MPVVLDSWAIMRLLEAAQPAALRVKAAIDSGDAVISWINLGEVLYVLRQSQGAEAAEQTIRDIESVVRTVLPDRKLVFEAAAIKSQHSMSYADCFAAATAMRFDTELWTGDPELFVDDSPWRAHNPMLS